MYLKINSNTSVKKVLKSPPWTSTLGLEETAEGKSSWPLQTNLLLKVIDIFIVGLNESRTSPITLPTIRGSKLLAILIKVERKRDIFKDYVVKKDLVVLDK